MSLSAPVSLENLSFLATGRTRELVQADLQARDSELRASVRHARILVIGGAGSIGAATVRILARLEPRVLHVVDQNENNLASLVRDLRSDPDELAVKDFRTFPLDFGSPIMSRLLSEMDSYHFILNFAAIKHVRSEKDVHSLLQMLDTNVVKALRLLRWLSEKRSKCRFFCVSSDKAANPVSLMGASKRIMEHTIFSREIVPELDAHMTSARFANVAFSDGSLLDSFLKRLQNRRPLAVPRNTRRYFISAVEAGQICLLSAVCGPQRHVLICRLDPESDLRDLQTVATSFLLRHGFEPRLYQDPREAKAQTNNDIAEGYYPLLLTEPNTAGEKPYEEFVGGSEEPVELGLTSLLGIKYSAPNLPEGTVAGFVDRIERFVSDASQRVSKTELVHWMSKIVPELRHFDSDLNLDERM